MRAAIGDDRIIRWAGEFVGELVPQSLGLPFCRWQYDIDAAAGNVQVDILDASGQLVQSLNLGEQPAGMTRFDWDGRDADGELLAAGHYRISARVVRGNNIESVPTFVRADIESVTLGQFGDAMTLNLAGGDSLSLSQIYQII